MTALDKVPGLTRDANGQMRLNEPVLAAAIATWLIARVGSLVVRQLHWMSAEQYTALSNKWFAIVSAVVLAGLGWLVRRYVQPAWKAVVGEAGKRGVTLPGLTVTDEEADRILAFASAGPALADRELKQPDQEQPPTLPSS